MDFSSLPPSPGSQERAKPLLVIAGLARLVKAELTGSRNMIFWEKRSEMKLSAQLEVRKQTHDTNMEEIQV